MQKKETKKIFLFLIFPVLIHSAAVFSMQRLLSCFSCGRRSARVGADQETCDNASTHALAGSRGRFSDISRQSSFDTSSSSDDNDSYFGDVDVIEKNAKAGELKAQRYLAWMYWQGEGVTQDLAAAAYWYEQAANQGCPRSQCDLAAMYCHGDGVWRDYERAAELYALAAEQGYARAESNLGFMYYHGLGLKQDCERATLFFQLAVMSGYAPAQCNLGLMYAQGLGVQRDVHRAEDLFKLAAAQGYAKAAACLQILHGR